MASSAAGHSGPDQYLQQVVVNVDQPQDHFIARRLARHVTVDARNKSGKIWVANAAQYAQGNTASIKRAENGSVRRIYGKNPSQISYECEERALDVFSDRQKIRRNEFVQTVIDEDLNLAVSNLMVEEELDAATLLLDTANYPAANTARLIDLDGTSGQYFSADTAKEHSDLVVAMQVAQKALRHRRPNAMVIDVESVYALQRAADRSDLPDSANKSVRTVPEVLLNLSSRLGIAVENIFVGKAQTADVETEAWSDIWGITEGNNATGFVLFFMLEDIAPPRAVNGGIEMNASLLLEVHEDLGGVPAGVSVGSERAGIQPPVVESWEEKKPVPGQNTRATCSRTFVMMNSGGAFLLRGTLAPPA